MSDSEPTQPNAESEDEVSEDDRDFKRQSKEWKLRKRREKTEMKAKELSRKMDLVQSKIGVVKTELNKRAPKGTTMGVLRFKKKALDEDLRKLERKQRDLSRKQTQRQRIFDLEEKVTKERGTVQIEEKERRETRTPEKPSRRETRNLEKPTPREKETTIVQRTEQSRTSENSQHSPIYSPMVGLPPPPGNPLDDMEFYHCSHISPTTHRSPIRFPHPPSKDDTSPDRRVMLFTPPLSSSSPKANNMVSDPSRQKLSFTVPGIAAHNAGPAPNCPQAVNKKQQRSVTLISSPTHHEGEPQRDRHEQQTQQKEKPICPWSDGLPRLQVYDRTRLQNQQQKQHPIFPWSVGPPHPQNRSVGPSNPQNQSVGPSHPQNRDEPHREHQPGHRQQVFPWNLGPSHPPVQDETHQIQRLQAQAPQDPTSYKGGILGEFPNDHLGEAIGKAR